MINLPIEIVIKILSYLNTYDLMQFCNACDDYSFLLQEKNIVQTLDFSGKFETQNIDLCKVIRTKINVNHVKVLNINYLYWLRGQDIRSLIAKLTNLEVLYAIDTRLDLLQEDIALYVKLKKLALSIENNEFNHATIIASENLTALKSLCLKVTQKTENLNGILLFFRVLKQLEELWICDESEDVYRINYGQLAHTLKNLKKFVIKSTTVLPYYDFTSSGLVKIFECKRSKSSTELVYEKILTQSKQTKASIFEPAENDYERSWQIFQNLHKDIPYGPKESELIYKSSINDVYFEELNFCHSVILCNAKYIQAALKILSSKHTSKLKKLSFRSCLFQRSPSFKPEILTNQEARTGFKKVRKGVQFNSNNHSFQTTANNLRNLRELEILLCPGCATTSVIDAYPLIGMFQYLEKLTLEVPLLLDGSFLKEVFMNCEHLETLNIFVKSQNDKFVTNLYQTLKYTNNLRHLRLEHTEISSTRLFNGIGEIKYNKLIRLAVICDTLRNNKGQEQAFTGFLEKNPQLILCLFIVANNTVKQNTDINRIMHNYKKGNSAKMYCIKKDLSGLTGVFPMPSAHRDFIFYRTNVAVINVDDF